jgi:hypothetical protein
LTSVPAVGSRRVSAEEGGKERVRGRTQSFAGNGDDDALRRLDEEDGEVELLRIADEVVEADATEAASGWRSTRKSKREEEGKERAR